MGGGQANSGQATTASNNANASSQENLNLSNEALANYNARYNAFFGKNGSLNGFLNPNSMNVTTPTGAYKLNYEQTVNQTQNAAQQGQQNIIRQAANNGLSLSSPAVAEMARETNLGTANLKGQDFANAVTQQHNDAMQNFWGASNLAAGQASGAGTLATQSAIGAGQTAANIYGTAGQYHANPATSIIGAGLGAAGAVGGGYEQACPAEGSLIRTIKGDRPIETLKAGEEICQLGNVGRLKCAPIRHHNQPLVRITTASGLSVTVSEKHAFVLPTWGYVNAEDLLGGNWQRLKTEEQTGSLIRSAVRVGHGTVYELVTCDGNKTYCVENFWSLE